MEDFISYLDNVIPDKDSLKIVRAEADRFCGTHSPEECHAMGLQLYRSENFQIQEVGVFLLGHASEKIPDALDFMKDTVSRHQNWKVQEILAMAFDLHCRAAGYENSLDLIAGWLNDDNANVRRAASEGLRVWTARPYFKEHPSAAVRLLSGRKDDLSGYVRKSVGNALKDISKKYPSVVSDEISTWDLSSKWTRQVYSLASKYLSH